MFRSMFSRRGGVAVAAATIGVASLSLAFAGTAGANPYPDNAGTAVGLVGSGSQTAYSTMQEFDNLFNGSPGCDLTATTSNFATLNCGTSSVTPGNADGEQGFAIAADNPYNDYAVEAPAVGSGNGATILESAGSGTPTSPISYARYSSHKGNSTVNDVEYATDGVSWTTFNTYNNVKTAQNKVVNITETDLVAIWNGTLTCTGAQFGGMDWFCLGAKTHSPIDVYVAQTGSGTYSTWQGALGFSKTGPGGIVNPGMEAGWPAADGSTLISAHENLFENQMATIAAEPDAADAIYFMSFGKYTTTCSGKKATVEVCAGTESAPAPKGKTYTTFGEINGVVAKQSTIQGTGGGAGVTFPITRGLYNSYNNSSATDPANQATLNYVGEDGFLCKASTNTEIDPQTGVTYRSEIENIITANGFFPLDVSGSTFAEGAGSLANPGTVTDSQYVANDNTGNTGATGNGFCLVTVG
jgi:hypothetical protein